MKTKSNPKNVAEQSIIDAVDRYLKNSTDTMEELYECLNSSYKNFLFILSDKGIFAVNDGNVFLEITQ